MSNLDAAWGATTADSDFAEDNVPPAGYMGIARVAATRTGTTKKSEAYFAVDLVDGDYRWSIFKQITKGGQPHEGSIKSAKITLRQLGLDVPNPGVLTAALKTIEGRYYSVEQVQSDRMNQTTGAFYVNTEITGPASAPAAPAAPAQPAPQVQAPPAVPAPQQVGGVMVPQPQQPGVAVFPAAVPGQEPTVVQQPGAQFGEKAPF